MIVDKDRRISGHSQQDYKEVGVNYGISVGDRLAGLGIRTRISARDLEVMGGDVRTGEITIREIDLGKGRFSKANGKVALDQGERGATLIEVLDLLSQNPEDFEGCQEIHVLGTSASHSDQSLVIDREGVFEWELKEIFKPDSLPNYSVASGSFFPTVKTS